MKSIFYMLAIFVFGCNSPVPPKEANLRKDTLITRDTTAKDANLAIDKSKFYTAEDTIVVSTLENDTLKYSKKDFNDIVDNFPALYSGYPEPPDVTFYGNKVYADVVDTLGNRDHISFNSECGQDAYYGLYAYFLKQKNGESKYATRRKKLIKIFKDINDIFGRLNYGGTYYGHQYPRIEGYAEYSIYWYSRRADFFDKAYDISNQRKLYIASIRQIIIDEVKVDTNTNGGKEKAAREKELFEIAADLDKLITDNFYLKMAQDFHYEHY